MSDVTRSLKAIEPGDSQTAQQLLPLVYQELRQLAAQQIAHDRPGQTLNPTALVHQAYLRLVGQGTERRYRDRGHFFAAAATAMRHIRIDQTRSKKSQKRAGNVQRLDFDEVARSRATVRRGPTLRASDALSTEVDKLATTLPVRQRGKILSRWPPWRRRKPNSRRPNRPFSLSA